MPKNPVVVLREELAKHNIELLDVYSYRDRDVIRILDRQAGKVKLYISKRKINSAVSKEDINGIVVDLLKNLSR